MDLTALRTAFLARGFNGIDASGTTRQDQFINLGYTRINEAAPWPWLYADATGAAPLTISDLQTVVSVVDTTNKNKLTRIDRRELVEADPTLAATDLPSRWYRDSDTQIKVWPASSSPSLSVRYLKVPPALSTGSDVPIIPTRYHLLIVQAAVIEAYQDAQRPEDAAAAEAVYQQRLGQMFAAYVDDSGPDYIIPVVSGWLATY